MDHAEAIELIEEAALEAGGLDRLMAGDTPESVALASHLVGCDDCTTALAALRRTTDVLRLVAADTPSPDLRARTLALVAAVGRPRGEVAGGDASRRGAPARFDGAFDRLRRAFTARSGRWAVAAVAGAAAFGLLAAVSFVAADLQGELDRTRQEAARMGELTSQVETLLRQPNVRTVALVAADGSAQGEVVFDPTSETLAVMSSALPAPPAGKEYRCWIDADGSRHSVGRMWFEHGLAYWSGTGAEFDVWTDGSTFGVSLETIGEPASQPAVLVGRL
jgi:hypothetical protein